MGAPKLNYIPKKVTPTPADKKKQEQNKAKIEQLRKHIQDKLKDPEMTKKAALIISEMLKSKK